MLMINWLFYTFKHLDYYFYQINGGVSLSCFIGGSYTTNPLYLVFLNNSNSPLLIQQCNSKLLFSLYETITSSLLRAIQSEMKLGHYINEYEQCLTPSQTRLAIYLITYRGNGICFYPRISSLSTISTSNFTIFCDFWFSQVIPPTKSPISLTQ